MPDTPFTDVDNAVYAALNEWTDLIAILAAERIHMADRTVDVRSQPGIGDMFKGIRVTPDGWDSNEYQVGATATQVLRYKIEIASAGLQLATIRAIEFQVFRALSQMSFAKQADGSALTEPTPWGYRGLWSIGPGLQRPEPQESPDHWVLELRFGIQIGVDLPFAETATAPVPRAGWFHNNTDAIVLLQFDRPLTIDVALDDTNWTFCINSVNQTISMAAALYGPFVVFSGVHASIGACGTNSLSYAASPADLLGSNGTAVAAFSDFPISIPS